VQLGGQLISGTRPPGLLPAGRGDDPHQLIIRAARQARAVLPGDRLHHGAQQRARGHRVGGAALREPGQGQVLRGQAHVQALLRPRAVLRRRGAVGLAVVRPGVGVGVGERVLEHAPRSVRQEKREE
jgi:hypothetical protein